ncbi:serine hydrolase domain-containing protein [Planctomonas psychrotolerans]|uniref:serine hydrolase domain-containing protein n=1 Tax=Planctomonas psychrotolerans TaxID=2528712 RepID=UPI001238E5AB|nr:serine hydrolase domain-containing protein [Planctomonas psychrotolerans]
MTAPIAREELASQVRRRLGARTRTAAATTVTADGITTAVIGAPEHADFEIGSISKGVTGLLYTDALSRGEVSSETTLGDLLPLGDSDLKTVTLASIAVHSSGLPSLPPAAQPLRGTLRLWRSGTNPYGETVDQLLEQARSVTLGSPRPRYSNLGFQLLGHAVASAAGSTYPDILRQRITEPLGLSTMHAPSSAAELRPSSVVGVSRSGRTMEPWTGAGIAPAGGIRSSIGDMARLARALLDGTAPGVTALDPVTTFTGPAVRIGAGWLTLSARSREITWHNGGTGGFRSWMGLDREAGTAVVVLAARSVSVDRHGFAMLADLTP